MTVPPPPPPPIPYTCLNCPDPKPQFLTKDALVAHWNATHTVPMIESATSVKVFGQDYPLPNPIVRKHVSGPDV